MTATVIDIETIPIDATEGMDLRAHVATLPPPPAPSRYSKRESVEKWQADPENQIEHYRRGVFRFADVRIATIGVCIGGDSRVIECFDDDADGLRALRDSLPRSGPIVVFGDYDPRVIRARMMAHGIGWGDWGIDAKPWDRRVVDLQGLYAEALNGSSRNTKGVSVDALCDWLGVVREDNPISGAGVLDAYIAGDRASIVAHCLADVRDEWALWSLMGVCRGE